MQEGRSGFVASICISFCRAFVFALAILLSVAPSSIRAQSNQTGTIHGTVSDQSGGALVGVSVTLTSPALIVPQTITADASGN